MWYYNGELKTEDVCEIIKMCKKEALLFNDPTQKTYFQMNIPQLSQFQYISISEITWKLNQINVDYINNKNNHNL